LDYGYDLARMTVHHAAAREPDPKSRCEIRADHGWQSTGWRLRAGQSYQLSAEGRFTVADAPRPWICEADGITIDFVAGRPLGRLIGTLRPEAASGENSAPDGVAEEFHVFDVGSRSDYVPPVAGVLYLRVNDSPASLHDNSGGLQVSISAATP
ncbi:MAG: hypothetical protein KDA61_03785, partial [Planctomycetales bacterium]|nr:hypothetical protein [Planctomycetales bacterium]